MISSWIWELQRTYTKRSIDLEAPKHYLFDVHLATMAPYDTMELYDLEDRDKIRRMTSDLLLQSQRLRSLVL